MNKTPPEEIERVRAWQAANQTHIREYQLRFYELNRDRLLAEAKAYRNDPKRKRKIRVRMAKWNKDKPWYRAWQSARQRCSNQNCANYSRYGGRGIKCFLTEADVKMLWVRDKAETQYQPSLDRINSDGDYTMDNCRFIPVLENSMAGLRRAWEVKRLAHEAKLTACYEASKKRPKGAMCHFEPENTA